MGLGAVALAVPGVALAEDRSVGRQVPGQAQGQVRQSRAGHGREAGDDLQQLYEFGTDKSIYRAAQKLQIRPWTIKVSGMVEKPFEIGFDELLAKVQLEERVYRHRCVETWSMIVPWAAFR